jgi:hypothetical protein
VVVVRVVVVVAAFSSDHYEKYFVYWNVAFESQD